MNDAPRSHTQGGYSAHVRMTLHVDGRTIPLSQVGGGTIVLRQLEALPSGPSARGVLVIVIDDERTEWDVQLGGQSADGLMVAVQCSPRSGDAARLGD